jgi:hypothetical protein
MSLLIAVELLALTGVAIAQPILDVFGRAPEFFVALRARPFHIVVFALAVILVPPAAIFAVEFVITRLVPSRRRVLVHVVVVMTLVGLLTVQVLKKTASWSGWLALLGAVGVATGVGIGYLRRAWVRTWIRFAAIGPVIFVASFLFLSPAHTLLGGASEQARTPVVAEPASRGPVVVIIFDELPVRSLLDHRGRIDAERFPGFGALAADSTWYRNTTAVATHTNYAVPAILTGRYADPGQVSPDAVLHPDNLFRLLGGAYRFNVVESKTQLCVVSRCNAKDPENRPDPEFVREPTDASADDLGTTDAPLPRLFERAIDVYRSLIGLSNQGAAVDAEQSRIDLPATTPTNPSTTTTLAPGATPTSMQPTMIDPVDAAARPAQFDSWLQTIDADTKHPQLSVIHSVLPHSPWFLDSNGVAYQVPEGDANLVGFEGIRWLDAPGAVATARQRHLLMTRYTDHLVRALQSRLEALGIWESTTVIVTSDHGAAFEPGGYFRRWEPANSVDVAGVPLFVHGPDFESGAVVDAPTQSVDIVPTIADVTNVRVPWRIDGVSMLGLPSTPRRSHPYVKASDDLGGFRVENLDVVDHLADLLARRPVSGADGGDDLAILRSGPSGALIGRSIDAVTIDAASVGDVHQQFPEVALDAFRADDSGVVPALVIGTLRDVDENETIVVVLDHQIAATATAFRAANGDVTFTALIPPEWLRTGAHRVQYFRLVPTAPGGFESAPVLAPLEPQ